MKIIRFYLILFLGFLFTVQSFAEEVPTLQSLKQDIRTSVICELDTEGSRKDVNGIEKSYKYQYGSRYYITVICDNKKIYFDAGAHDEHERYSKLQISKVLLESGFQLSSTYHRVGDDPYIRFVFIKSTTKDLQN